MRKMTERRDALLWVDPATVRRLRKRAQKLDDDSSGFYMHMFLDDVDDIVGFGLKRPRFALEVDGISEDQLAAAISTQFASGDSDRVLGDMLTSTMQDIVLDGASFWQLTMNPSKDQLPDGSQECPFLLERLPAWTIRWLPLGVYQFVPAEYSTVKLGRELRLLDRSRILRFRITGSLGRELRSAVRLLRRVDRWAKVDHRLTVDNLDTSSAYDKVSRDRLVVRGILRETRRIGWSVRGLSHDGLLEPTYTAWRNIRFESFKAQCREMLIVQVNTVLQSVGKNCGFSARISTPGLRSSLDLEGLLDDLQNGGRQLADLIAVSPESES